MFGTNGIRGIANEYLSCELALRIGRSVGAVLGGRIAVATDTRVSSEMIKSALASGLMSVGSDVLDLGMVPTPALQHFVKNRPEVTGGVMITASHNPPEFNGIKCISGDGTECTPEEEARIEDLYETGVECVSWRDVGSVTRVEGAGDEYVESVVSAVDADLIGHAGLTVCVDCANGASVNTTPELMRRLGVRAITLNGNPQGEFPGHPSEPTEDNLSALKRMVVDTGADLGIAHDGDADRCVFVTGDGRYVSGDVSLALLSRYILGRNGGGKVVVSLIDKEDREVASATVKVSSKNWKKCKAVLTAEADVEDARLCIAPSAGGTYHFDMVSLFPQNTFKGRKNGLRADLAQTLADLHPRFVRFPGGCVAHGDGIDNIYDWKGSIGPLEARKPLRNLWGYHQTRGLGYFEYFQFCEDIGAEPVPVLAAGVPCQNSGGGTQYGHDDLTKYGQQCGIPMEQMPEYVQDVLDLIEYANGDARKTEWGRKRAEAGHPESFNLKYIGIGNEDLITEVFEERFTMIYNAVREKYPEVTVIGTVGPFYEGTDYNEGWKLASKLDIPMVDEHYYVAPGWFIHNQDYYDRYDRSKSKVYLGEYAAHLPGRPSNIETALSEALYLTAVERNADVVTMTSYAPLLAKEGHTQWSPDLIYFNNSEVKPTVGYYTQQLFGQNAGNHYIPSTVILDNERDAVQKRIGMSVVKNDTSGDYIVKLVNMLKVEVKTKINMVDISLLRPIAT